MTQLDDIISLLDGEIQEINIDARGIKTPDKNDKIALIDADTLVYTVCLSVEQQEELLPNDMYTSGELKELLNHPNYDKETNSVWTIDLDEALIKAEEKIQLILDRTGCEDCELHFSVGKDNFRYEVKPDYKANRTGRSPSGLYDLKNLLLKKYTGTMSSKWEADDIVVYLKEQNPDKYIMVAVDKDLLHSVVGRHFNYYESALYNIEMKWVETDTETKLKWAYIQSVMGDRVDNIQGIKGIGKAKAPKLFASCTTEKECWNKLVEVYEANDMTMIDALITMRLVNMHQFNGTDIVLFDPRKFGGLHGE